MHQNALLVGLLLAGLSLAGCLDGGGGGNGNGSVQRDCRTVEAELFVTSTTNADVPIYTLNDGEREMRVVAMGFQLGGGNPDELEVPNPQIRLKECQTLQLTITNLNALPHTFHLHGGIVDWQMDGVPFLSQNPIHQGESFTYVFEDLKAGTYWYHCHVDVAHHIDLGMYGAFIVEEWEPEYDYDEDLEEHVLTLDEWDNCHIHGGIDPTANREQNAALFEMRDCEQRQFTDYTAQGGAGNTATSPLCNDPNTPQEIRDALGCDVHGDPPPGQDPRTWYYQDFPVYAPEYNTFTINGKAFPDTNPIVFEEGKTYRIRLINVGEEWHSMHVHGHNMQVIKRDGYYVPQAYTVDTLSIGPGERFDVLIHADNPGFWAFHDHVGLNVMNDHQAPGGMFTVIAYDGLAEDLDAGLVDQMGFELDPTMRAIEVMDFTKAYHDKHGGHAMGSPSSGAKALERVLTPAGTVLRSW